MKYFVITDVHSFYDEMIEALNKAGFEKDNPEHVLVSCGDLFDRGKKPQECLEYVMSVPKERRMLVMGNHDENLMDLVAGNRPIDGADKHNGTRETVAILSGTKDWHEGIQRLREDSILQDYFNELKDYHETDKYIFVHGWIPWDIDDSNPNNKQIYYIKDDCEKWKISRWKNGMLEWHTMKWYENYNTVFRGEKKTIVCGHWHTSYGHSHFHRDGKEFPPYHCSWKNHCNFEPFVDAGIIALDACTALTGFCNVVVLEENS